jgi:hypothetical protein
VIEKSTNNSLWILPLMIIGYGTLYYFNPHINLTEVLEPIVNKIDTKIPSDFPKTFVVGTFIYKFITISISYFTGVDLNPFKDGGGSLSDDDRKNIKEIISNYKGLDNYSPSESLTTEEKEEYNVLFPKEEDLNTPKPSASKLPDTPVKVPPYNENPFKRIKVIPHTIETSEIKIEDWN